MTHIRHLAARVGSTPLAAFALLATSAPTVFAQDAPDTDPEPTTAQAPPPDATDDPVAFIDWVIEWVAVNGPGYAIAILQVLAILLVGWIVAGRTAKIIRAQGDKRAKIDVTLARFIASIVRWAILALAGILCLGAFGIETTSFAALIAAAGLAVGLALQGSLSNFASGAMLLIFRPFKVGDYITAAGQSGTVQEIQLLTTTLDTPQNVRIVIPNSAIFAGDITNYSHHELRRCDIAVGVDYTADIDRTREVLEQAIASLGIQLDEPKSVAFLSGLGASSVDWVCRIWCPAADFWVVHEKATRAVKVHLDQAGISIPFPQMDIHLDRTDNPGA